MNPKFEKVILVAALILPMGLVVLGAWKAYELYKQMEKDEPETNK